MGVPLQPLLLRDTQVAEVLSISRKTVWNRVKSGALPKPIKWQGVTVWRMSDLQDFVSKMAG
jgi:predicted DNA-binding transcriptional regulator AlpA